MSYFTLNIFYRERGLFDIKKIEESFLRPLFSRYNEIEVNQIIFLYETDNFLDWYDDSWFLGVYSKWALRFFTSPFFEAIFICAKTKKDTPKVTNQL